AELSHYIETLSRYATDEMPTHLRMTLIETGPQLLGPFPERISKSVEAKLRQLGIDVRTNTKVVGADAKGVILDGGQRIEAPEVVSKLDGLEVNHRGQIVVRPTLQSKEDDSVFALGDCSSFSGVDGRPLPTTAQVARQEAVFLARSLVGYLRQNSPLAEFHF